MNSYLWIITRDTNLQSTLAETLTEIIDNANKVRMELFKLYNNDNGVRIVDKVTFQSGEELLRT
jgi:hypothetical protein